VVQFAGTFCILFHVIPLSLSLAKTFLSHASNVRGWALPLVSAVLVARADLEQVYADVVIQPYAGHHFTDSLLLHSILLLSVPFFTS
jgi:hypothetical protein